jgi:hypothetical protein
VAVRGQLDRVVFLTRYAGPLPRWDPLPPSLLAGRLFSIVHHEISSSLHSLFALGAADLIDVPTYFTRASRVVEQATTGRVVEQLSIPAGASPQVVAETVLSRIRHGD